jgi:putative transposase
VVVDRRRDRKSPLGGAKTGRNPTDRGKLEAKRSVMVKAAGIPIGLATDGANRNDCKLTAPTILSIAIERPEATAQRPQGVCLDKAYDHDFVRELLAALDFTPHIRSRGEEARDLRNDLGERARRWVVERTHSWITRYRALLIRWSKKSVNHDALLMFCFALITWQQMGVLGLSR